MPEDTKQMGIRIPISMYHELKQIAHTRGLTITDIAIEAFIKYLDVSTPGLCPSCHYQNDSDANYCQKCGLPLTDEGKFEVEQMYKLINSNPELISAFKSMLNKFQKE